MYGTNFNDARALCEAANAHDLAARFVGPDKVGIAFEVRAHAWGEYTGVAARWGLWPRWRYSDMSDRGFGGPFVALQAVRDALPPKTLTFHGSHGHIVACAVSGHIIEASACNCGDCALGGYSMIALVDVLALHPDIVRDGGGDILDAALIYQDGGYEPPVISIDGEMREEILRLPAPALRSEK